MFYFSAVKKLTVHLYSGETCWRGADSCVRLVIRKKRLLLLNAQQSEFMGNVFVIQRASPSWFFTRPSQVGVLQLHLSRLHCALCSRRHCFASSDQLAGVGAFLSPMKILRGVLQIALANAQGLAPPSLCAAAPRTRVSWHF